MIRDNEFLFRGQVFSFLNCSYEQRYNGNFEIVLRGIFQRDAIGDDNDTFVSEIPLEKKDEIIENKSRNSIEDLEVL